LRKADGNIFTIKAKAQPIAIKRFDINMAGPPASLEIYFLPGVDPGRKDKNYVYQKIFEGIVGPGLGRNNVTSLPELINPVFIPAGASYSFYITFAKFASLHMQTKRGLPVGSVIISDEYTEVLEGYGMLYPFESYSPGWRWNGEEHIIETDFVEWNHGIIELHVTRLFPFCAQAISSIRSRPQHQRVILP
jgi:hypothetical protein